MAPSGIPITPYSLRLTTALRIVYFLTLTRSSARPSRLGRGPRRAATHIGSWSLKNCAPYSDASFVRWTSIPFRAVVDASYFDLKVAASSGTGTKRWSHGSLWMRRVTPNNRFERSRGRVFVGPRRGSMIEINQLRWSATQPRVAQPHR
jgi:hypothetical protein